MRLLYSLTLLFAGSWACHAQAYYETIALDYGPHPVGYQHTVATDRTRPYERTMDYSDTLTFRPMPISSWYPLAAGDGRERVAISDYTRVLKEEEEYESLPDAYFFSWFYYPETPAGKANLGQSTHSFRGGRPLQGKHPIIIYAPSYQASSAENFILCEYLASLGYHVLATPSRGVSQRKMGKGTTAEAEAQLADLNFLVGYTATLPTADLDRIYTIGFSFGSFPSILLALRNRYVKGVISLDGTVQYLPEVLVASSFYRKGGLRVPFVHFSQKTIPDEVLEEDGVALDFGEGFAFFDSLQFAPAYHFRAKYLTHGNFSAMGVLLEPRDLRQEFPESQIVAGYADLCKRIAATLVAMDDYRPLPAAWDHAGYVASLDSSKMTLLAHKTPNTKRYTMPDFATAMRRADYQNLEEVYADVRKNYPNFQIRESDLNTMGLQLGFSDETLEAGLSVFHFAIALFPESGNLYDSLAEVYFMAGNRNQARRYFRRSLELSPENSNAGKRLEELRQ